MQRRVYESITDVWESCPVCGGSSCRVRSARHVDAQLQVTTFVEERCLNRKCQYRWRGERS
jgi:hypothetical protein